MERRRGLQSSIERRKGCIGWRGEGRVVKDQERKRSVG